MTVSVPGNLLVAGEYLVLEEGGPGVALALEPRAYAQCGSPRPHGTSRPPWVRPCKREQSAPRWAPGHGQELPLAEAVFQAAAALWRQEGIEARPQAIVLDSSAFFGPDGRKAGFGSSAASAVALALIFGKAAGLEGSALKGFALKAALRGHRASPGRQGLGL
jgi:phosphomevalonate kinase